MITSISLISSFNTMTCNPALGLHMEDLQEHLTAMYFKKMNKRFLFTKETNFARSYTVLNLVAVRCLCKI